MATNLKKGKKDAMEEKETLTRIAIVNQDKCKPKKCSLECKKACPVNRTGKLCIEVTPTQKVAQISEGLCIGCGICVKRCPFEAIHIINLPSNLSKETTHRYGPNTFKLHRLPMPRTNQVLGLVGQNGTGKSTALKILAGKLKPNLGKYDSPPDWTEVLTYFRGSELQNYLQKILEDDMRAMIKPQYVDHIPKMVKGTVNSILTAKDELGAKERLCEQLELNHVLTRDLIELSGGELQRFAIATVCVQKADVYMFDEPSSYLDVKQRLAAGRVVRSMLSEQTYVVVVEHDLAILDYLSDFVCVLYGVPGAYGVVTMPFGVREGLNIFLEGFIRTENLRFRESELMFNMNEADTSEVVKKFNLYSYPDMVKTFAGKEGSAGFKLTIEKGEFTDSEIVVLLGQNGVGKTTFIRLLAGLVKPDTEVELPTLNVSYKPQKLSATFEGSVRALLYKRVKDAYTHPQFVSDVTKPLMLDQLIDHELTTLSGGELQRVGIILCLATPADIYLIDEPSAYLDSEQRIICAKVIKRYIMHCKKTAFVVEHDFIMATYLADRVIVYKGDPGVDCTACTPESLLTGMNRFLKMLDITFRRDPTNFRPRINKLNSVNDQEQKAAGNYFFLEQ